MATNKTTSEAKPERNVKFEIDDGTTFYADEVGIIHNPIKLILDFKNITPRVDVRNNEYQPIVIKHNAVVMDLWTGKVFLEGLRENLENYERKFGKIEAPQAIKKAEEEMRKDSRGKRDMPSYLG